LSRAYEKILSEM